MRTHNMGFYEDLTKIIFQLSNSKHMKQINMYMSEPCHEKIFFAYPIIDTQTDPLFFSLP